MLHILALVVGKMNNYCALALLVPTRLSSHIQDIRRDHDKAYERWMPHINLLFPFVLEHKIPDVTKRLTDELSKLPSFVLILNEVGSFSQREGNTFHLKPKDETKMLELYAAVRRAIPEFKPQRKDFHPHLTLGQWKKSENPTAMLQSMFVGGISVVVDKLCIITRTKDGPFSVNTEIPLGVSVEGGYED